MNSAFKIEGFIHLFIDQFVTFKIDFYELIISTYIFLLRVTIYLL